jgi:hypothetical protein
MSKCLCLLLAAGLARAVMAQPEPATPPASAAGPPDYAERVREIAAEHGDIVAWKEIGRSRRDRPLVVARVAAPGENDPDQRPALLIVAGVDGRHRVGSEVAARLLDSLAADPPEFLQSTTVFILPCLNPDTIAWHADPDHVRVDFGRVFGETDADHDRRSMEDPADDLNEDGVITLMRVKDPGPGTGLRAEYLIDPENAKLLKRADPAKGERAEYALLVEGEDNDGDGLFNEDGPGGAGGGVDLNMNFPYRWPELTDGAGMHQLSEPESRAIARWMLDTPNIGAVLVYGPGDTLINIPEAGKMDPSGQVPLGIEQGDKQAFDDIAKLYKEATKINEAPGIELAGSFVGWAYGTYGVPAFQSQVWVRPDQLKSEEKKEEPKKDEAGDAKPEEKPSVEGLIEKFRAAGPEERQRLMEEAQKLSEEDRAKLRDAVRGLMGGGGGRGRGGGGGGGPRQQPQAGAKQVTGDDAKWLKLNEDRVAAGEPSRFIEWAPFEHPQLGEVEIGGFVPGFKHTPRFEDLDGLVAAQGSFLEALAGKLPRLVAKEPLVEPLGPGIYRITVRVVNEGGMPSISAIGAKARRALPTIVSLDIPIERLVAGERIARHWGIPPNGGLADTEWVVSGRPGSDLKIDFAPTVGAERTVTIQLPEAGR